MNRRQYLTTVGASFTGLASVSVQDVRGAADEDSNPTPSDESTEREPVYYTVSVPAIDQQFLHISIPAGVLDRADIIRTRSRGVESTHNIVDKTRTEDWDDWELLNLPIQSQSVESVQVEEYENGERQRVHGTTKWDEMELESVTIFTTASEDGYGYLGVAGGGQPVHIETRNRYWTFEETTFERIKVRTTNTTDIFIKTITEDERLDTVPMFEMDTRTLSPTITRR